MEIAWKVEFLLLEGVNVVAGSVYAIDFGQGVATFKRWLPEPTIIAAAAISWELLGED